MPQARRGASVLRLLWEGTSCSARVKLFVLLKSRRWFWALDLRVVLSPLQLLSALALPSHEILSLLVSTANMNWAEMLTRIRKRYKCVNIDIYLTLLLGSSVCVSMPSSREARFPALFAIRTLLLHMWVLVGGFCVPLRAGDLNVKPRLVERG